MEEYDKFILWLANGDELTADGYHIYVPWIAFWIIYGAVTGV